MGRVGELASGDGPYLAPLWHECCGHPGSDGFLEAGSAASRTCTGSARAEPSQSPGAGARPSSSKGPTPMMYDLILSASVPVLGIAALAVVYVASKDPDQRARAWQLLKLLLRR